MRGRYELGAKIGARGDLVRYRGIDYGAGALEPVPVIILEAPLPAAGEAVALGEVVAEAHGDAVSSSDTAVGAEAEVSTIDFVPANPGWPISTPGLQVPFESIIFIS